MTTEEIVKNNFESKVSIKIETNSRGYNTTIHCYQGVSEEEIDDTIAKSVYGLGVLQDKLKSKEEIVAK